VSQRARNVDRYLLSARRSAANPPHVAAAVEWRNRQTDGQILLRMLRAVPITPAINSRPSTNSVLILNNRTLTPHTNTNPIQDDRKTEMDVGPFFFTQPNPWMDPTHVHLSLKINDDVTFHLLIDRRRVDLIRLAAFASRQFSGSDTVAVVLIITATASPLRDKS